MANEDVLITPASEKIEFKQGASSAVVYGLLTGDGTNFIVSGADDINISPGEDDKISFQYGGSGRLRFIPNDGASTDPFIIQGQGEYLGVGTEIQFRAYSSNVDTMRLTDSARVGIGTTTPAQKLYVSGGATTLDNAGGYALYFKNAGTQYGAIDTYGGSLSIEAVGEAILSGASGVMLKGPGVYLSPTGTSAGDTMPLKFRELAANGTANVNLRAPDSIASDITMVLPSAAGTVDQHFAISSVAGGVMTMGFADAGGGGTFGGSLSDNYIPIGTAADTIGNFVLGLAENNSIWIGNDPSSTTSTAEYNVALGSTALDAITTGDNNVAVGVGTLTSLTEGSTNTAMGLNAGQNVTTGGSNTYVGYDAGKSGDTYSNNTAFGAGALRSAGNSWNTAIGVNAARVYTGHSIVALGYEAGSQNVAGGGNTIIGNVAYYNHSGGASNVVIGSGSMYGDDPTGASSSSNNTAVGTKSMYYASGSEQNVAIGVAALAGTSNHVSNYNVVIGYKAASGTTGMDQSIVIGRDAALNVQDAQSIVAIGYQALYDLTSGDHNVGIGQLAGADITTGEDNTVVGNYAGRGISTGLGNTAIGYDSLYKATIGGENVAVGKMAGYNYAGTTSSVYGAFSTFLGYAAGYAVTGGNSYGHVIAIGHQPMYNATGANKSMAIGNSALVSGTNAVDMIAIGHGAGSYGNATGSVYLGNKAGFRPSGNYNVAIGQEALSGASSGTGFGTAANNVVIGRQAMVNATSASNNVAVGYLAMKDATTASTNTAVGYYAATGTTVGQNNTAVGVQALQENTDGDDNTAIGHHALYNTNAGDGVGDNVGVGSTAGWTNSTGVQNVFVGYRAGYGNTTASQGVMIGREAGYTNTTGTQNVFIGSRSGYSNTIGNYNVALGSHALNANVDGDYNTAIGYNSMLNYEPGDGEGYNIAIGAESFLSGTTGEKNISIGYHSLWRNTIGNNNTAVGHEAGRSTFSTTSGGSNNTFIGYRAAYYGSHASGAVAIGYRAGRDFGYDNAAEGNTAIGHQAGFNTTSAEWTTLVGVSAGAAMSHGNYNVAVGAHSMYAISGTTNAQNVAVGAGSMRYASGSNYNVAVGDHALSGASAGMQGDNNVAVGRQAMALATNPQDNVAIGYKAAYDLTTGLDNVVIGSLAGQNITTGSYNTIIGTDAGDTLTTADANVIIGRGAGQDCNNDNNTYVGQYAANSSTTGESNTAIGKEAGRLNLTGNNNTSVGLQALYSTTKGNNTAIGVQAGYNNTTGTGNVFIGYQAGKNTSHDTESNKLVIANSNTTTPLIDGDFSSPALTVNAGLTAHGLRPVTDNTYTIGTAALRYTEAHIDDGFIAINADGAVTNHAGAGRFWVSGTTPYFNASVIQLGTGTPVTAADGRWTDGTSTSAPLLMADYGAVANAASSAGTATYLEWNNTTSYLNARNIAVGSTFKLGGEDVTDIKISSDGASTSDDDLVTAGYVNAHGGGSPGGSDTQVQFNDGGSFGGDAGLTYVKATDTLTAGAYNLENLDDQLTWAGRTDLLIQGTTSYDMDIISPQDIGFSIDSDNDGSSTHAFMFKTDTKTPTSAGTELMRIQDDGKVGIGTTAPSRKLHVYGDDNLLARFESSDDTAMVSIRDNDTYGQIGVKDGYMFMGYSASMTTNNLVLTNTNTVVKVGIGTIAPAYNLDVVGTTQLSGAAKIVGSLDFPTDDSAISVAATDVVSVNSTYGLVSAANMGLKHSVADSQWTPGGPGSPDEWQISTNDKIQTISTEGLAGTAYQTTLPAAVEGLELMVVYNINNINATYTLIPSVGEYLYSGGSSVSSITFNKDIFETIHVISPKDGYWTVMAHT